MQYKSIAVSQPDSRTVLETQGKIQESMVVLFLLWIIQELIIFMIFSKLL